MSPGSWPRPRRRAPCSGEGPIVRQIGTRVGLPSTSSVTCPPGPAPPSAPAGPVGWPPWLSPAGGGAGAERASPGGPGQGRGGGGPFQALGREHGTRYGLTGRCPLVVGGGYGSGAQRAAGGHPTILSPWQATDSLENKCRGCGACPGAVQCSATPVAHLARMRAIAPVIRVRGGRAVLLVVPARTTTGPVKSVLWRGRPPPDRPVTVVSAARPAGACGTNPAPPHGAPTTPDHPTVQPPRIRPHTRPTPDLPPTTTRVARLTPPQCRVLPHPAATDATELSGPARSPLSSVRESAPTPRHQLAEEARIGFSRELERPADGADCWPRAHPERPLTSKENTVMPSLAPFVALTFLEPARFVGRFRVSGWRAVRTRLATSRWSRASTIHSV